MAGHRMTQRVEALEATTAGAAAWVVIERGQSQAVARSRHEARHGLIKAGSPVTYVCTGVPRAEYSPCV